MLSSLSQRLLPALQLTRMALVFTAISNAQCTLLLQLRSKVGEQSLLPYLRPRMMLLMAMVSIGLYGFGMALNDIIDRRRDRQLAAHRPLPSGRIGLIAAHVICVCLGLTALLAGVVYAREMPRAGLGSVLILVWTGILIAFYDYAGKYLVAPGLITLGLIRFFHAVIPAPGMPLLWHPLLLLNHVTILSALAYVWEAKRPVLTRPHWWMVFGGLGALDVMATGAVWWRTRNSLHGMWIKPELLLPLACAALFVLVVLFIRARSRSPRQAGQAAMLVGLLWLIVYDAAFAAAYVGPAPALMLLALMPVAYACVQLMRWWSSLLLLSRQPQFKRIEADDYPPSRPIA